MTSIPAYCIIFHVMAAPVNPQQRPAGQTQQHQPANPPAPAGVGSAPNTVAPAAGNNAQGNQAPTGPGYIESGIQWLGGWISWIFKKLLSCCYREDPPEVDNTPIPPRIRPPQLGDRVRTQVELLEAVGRLTDLQRSRLYRLIGQDTYRRSHMGSWLSSFESIGESAVQQDPTILRQYLNIQ